MTERWQQRRVEDELLKRELLLRLRAEHDGVPGRGEPATDQFRRRVRRLLLRHPLFALKLYLLLIDAGLGRVDGRKRSYQRGSPTRVGRNAVSPRGLDMAAQSAGDVERVARANPHVARAIRPAKLRRRVHGRARRPPRDLSFAYRRCESAFARVSDGFRQQRLFWRRRLVRELHICKAAVAAGLAALRRQESLWLARLVHGCWACRSFGAALVAELRRGGGLSFARLAHALRTFGSGATDVVAEGRRYWSVFRVAVVRFTRASASALTGLVAAGRRQGVLLYARFVHLRRGCGSRLVRLLAELRRKRLVLGAHLVRVLRTFGMMVDGLVAERRRQRPVLRVGLIRVARKCAPSVMVLVAAGRRQRLALRMRLIRAWSTSGSALAGLVAAWRRERRSWYERLLRADRACRSAVADLVGAGRQLVSQGRVALSGPHPRAGVAEALVPRRRSGLRLSGSHRSRPASTATGALPIARFSRPARGVLAGVALVAVAVSAVLVMRNVGPNGENNAAGSTASRSTDQILQGFLHLPLTGRSRTAPTQNSPHEAKHVEQAQARTVHPDKPRVAQRMTLVSNTVQSAAPTAPTASTTAAASNSTGPSPLRAPPGGSGPSPLKAP